MSIRVEQLLKSNRSLFHTQDLALLWDIRNKNTLYTTIKRYIKKGILYRIHKGYYATLPPEEIDPDLLIAGSLHRYCYRSVESVLAAEGVIFQEVRYHTFISDLSGRSSVYGYPYHVRQLRDPFLFNGEGVVREKGALFTATLERAVADILYFAPDYYFDNPEPIDHQEVKRLQEHIGYS